MASQPSPAIHGRPFGRFDEIFDLVEKASDLTLASPVSFHETAKAAAGICHTGEQLMTEGGMGESSEAVSEPPGGPVAAGSRIVFLSYASPDAAVANQICQFLESHGVACWMAPRDVKPGAAYADAIVRAINEASALVLVLSGSAMASEHVSREVERAASKHKQIVAFRVDAAALSAELEYFLSRSQWIDAPALGMPRDSRRKAQLLTPCFREPSCFRAV
jgi:TIR domain